MLTKEAIADAEALMEMHNPTAEPIGEEWLAFVELVAIFHQQHGVSYVFVRNYIINYKGG